jgi:hypothetical protein
MPRPVVQPQLFASLTPQTYEGGMAPDQAKKPVTFNIQNTAQTSGKGGHSSQGLFGGGTATAEREAGDVTDQPMDATASVSALASASQLGELFEYTVGNVSLPRQKSAMIPIITDNVGIERVSIYNPNVMERYPLNGARLRNSTDKHLLQGPVTVFDGSAYAGDARIDDVPPGQERLLSYGVDLQMIVDASKADSNASVQTAKIVKGVLEIERKYQNSREYVAENKSSAEKTLIIEHPRGSNSTLVEPKEPMETTDSLYRFKGKVPAGQKSKLVVREEQISEETFAILPCDLNLLIETSRNTAVPKDVKDSLVKAVGYRQALTDFDRQINDANEKLKQITDQQSRIRENMKSVDKSSQYYTRLLGKLNDQETEIEKLQTSRDELIQQRDDQRKQLEDYLKDLTIG